MQLANFTINQNFSRSARIDSSHSIETIESYVFHDTAKNTFAHLFKSYANNQTAFTITGPYGSGKSSLAIILDQLLTSDTKVRHACAERLVKSRKQEFKKIMPDIKKQWFSIKIVGKRSNCLEDIAQSLDSAINLSSLKFSKNIKLPTKASTAGIMDKLKELSTYLNKNNSGLILVIDEMGKYLEYAAQSDGDIFIFQEIAEVFTKLKTNLGHELLFINILHQSFEDYAAHSQSNAFQLEWTKIQGRFENILFNLGFEQSVDLIAGALKGKIPIEPNKKFLDACSAIIKQISKGRFKTRDNLDESLIACYPMSPLATLILGPVAKEKFGQNERSLFTFLASSEPHGFANFIKNDFDLEQRHNYTAADLWDYLELNYESTIIASSMAHAYAEVKECIRRADQLDNQLALNLTKAMALIELFGRKSGIVASKKMLEIIAPEKLAAVIKELEEKSIILFRKSQNEYRLFEGSDIDINNEVELQKAQINWDWQIILNEIPLLRPVVPKRHFYSTGSLRWFERRIVSIDHFKQLNNDLTNFDLIEDISGLFLLFVPDKNDTPKLFASKLKELELENKNLEIAMLYGESDFATGQAIADLALEIAALRRTMITNEAINDDRVAKNEFESRLGLSINRLQELLNIAFDDASWIYENKKQKAQPLSVVSSEISDQIYVSAPKIKNELINRDQPSTIAVSGRSKLIACMTQKYDQENLGIVGNPPEMSFYLSLLKEENLHKKVNGEWIFAKPKTNSSLTATYLSLNDILDNMQRKSVTEIYALWGQPPYGIKKGIMPILLIAFYLARIDEFAIYEENVFRPNIDEIFIEKMMFSPELVFIQKIDLDKKQELLITRTREFVNQSFKQKITSDSVLEICKPLVNAAYQLPAFVRRTRSLDKVDKNAQALRQALVSTKNPYELLFTELPNICLGETFDFDKKLDDKKIDQFISVLSSLWAQLDNAYQKMIQSMNNNLITLFDYEKPTDGLKKIQSRCNKLLNMEGINNTFAARLLEGTTEQETLEQVLTYVSEKPIDNWTDSDFSNAKLKLVDYVNEFKRMERLIATYNKSETASTFTDFKNAYLVDIVISQDNQFKNMTKLLDLDADQEQRIKTVAHSSIQKLPSDMSKDEKIAVAIEILKSIEDETKEQLNLFEEVASENN